MSFPPENVLKDLREYAKLPDTQEKQDIDKKYLSDEIGQLEFYSLAMNYMRSVEKTNR